MKLHIIPGEICPMCNVRPDVTCRHREGVQRVAPIFADVDMREVHRRASGGGQYRVKSGRFGK